MKQKKESLVELLETGKRETLQASFKDQEGDTVPALIRISTSSGAYSFYDDTEQWKQIVRGQNRLDRETQNRLKYGCEQGRAGVWHDNRTAIELGKLKRFINYDGWAPIIRRAYELAQQAPTPLRKAVFHNYLLAVRKRDYSRFVQQDGAIDILKFSYETAEVMPTAWYRDVEVSAFRGVTLESMMKDLQPEGMLAVGTEIKVRGKKAHEHITMYRYLPFRYGDKYMDAQDTPLVLWYAIDHYGHKVFRFDQVVKV